MQKAYHFLSIYRNTDKDTDMNSGTDMDTGMVTDTDRATTTDTTTDTILNTGTTTDAALTWSCMDTATEVVHAATRTVTRSNIWSRTRPRTRQRKRTKTRTRSRINPAMDMDLLTDTDMATSTKTHIDTDTDTDIVKHRHIHGGLTGHAATRTVTRLNILVILSFNCIYVFYIKCNYFWIWNQPNKFTVNGNHVFKFLNI